MSAILRLESVSKRFGAVLAADHLSLELAEGEAFGVIGPNGSGKTTMFNIITGMTKADSGRVFFNGTEITNLQAFERCRRGIARSCTRVRVVGALGTTGVIGPSGAVVVQLLRKSV